MKNDILIICFINWSYNYGLIYEERVFLSLYIKNEILDREMKLYIRASGLNGVEDFWFLQRIMATLCGLQSS